MTLSSVTVTEVLCRYQRKTLALADLHCIKLNLCQFFEACCPSSGHTGVCQSVAHKNAGLERAHTNSHSSRTTVCLHSLDQTIFQLGKMVVNSHPSHCSWYCPNACGIFQAAILETWQKCFYTTLKVQFIYYCSSEMFCLWVDFKTYEYERSDTCYHRKVPADPTQIRYLVRSSLYEEC